MKILQEVRYKVGDDEFDETFKHFDLLKNSGCDVYEIISTDTDTPIDREEHVHYEMQEVNEDGKHDSEGDSNDQSEDGDDSEERTGDEIISALEQYQMESWSLDLAAI